MKPLFNFRLTGILSLTTSYKFCFYPFIILYLLLAFNTNLASQISDCEIELPTLAADNTLCDDYYEIVTGDPDHIFGGSITMASQFTGDITGNIIIANDFKVDRPLRIYNAIIYVWPAKKIYLQYSQTAIDEGYSNLNNRRPKLILDNCKIFSCDYLWKGIEVNSKTDLVIKNNSIIEDAEKTVHAINTNGATLDISTTTFNRNLNGIYLSNSAPYQYDPVFKNFNKNKFTCSSSLNGMTNKRSETGIYLNNINANIKTTLSLNILADYTLFENQDNGVLLEGSTTFLSANFLNFQFCRNAGIMLTESSSLELFRSNFDQIFKFGIYGKSLRNMYVDYSDFHFDFFEFSNEIYSSGIYIESIRNGGIIDITDSEFLTDEGIPTSKNCAGVFFEGNEMNTNVYANITSNNFVMEGADLQGVVLKGTFSPSFHCNISGNGFRIKSIEHQTGKTNVGISLIDGDKWGAGHTDGDKYTIRVIDNLFEGYHDYQNESSHGIKLIGSRPKGTEISSNDFKGHENHIWTLNSSIDANDYMLTAICDNTDYFTGLGAFSFQNMCLSSDITINTFYGGINGFWLGASTAIMGTQWHKGNEFIPVYIPLPSPPFPPNTYAIYSPFPINIANPLLSRVFVTPPQSVVFNGPGYTVYNKYFPADITPNDGTWFRGNNEGEEAEDCTLSGSPQPIVDTLDILIANAVLDLFPDSARKWEAQRYLYQKLMFDSLYTTLHSDFSDFLGDMEGTIIGDLFEIEALIQKGCTMAPSAKDQVLDLDSSLTDILFQRDSISAISSWTNQNEFDLNEVYDSLFTLKSLLEDLDLNNEIERNDYIDSAKVLLNGLPNQNKIYIENSIILYKYLVDIIDEGYEALDSLDLVDIMDRASTCPNYGGISVYGLRGLLKRCDHSKLVDDFIACDSTGAITEIMPDTVYNYSPFMAPYDFKIADAGATLKPAEKSFEDNSEDCFVLAYVYSIDGRLIRVFDNKRELEEYQFGNNRVSSQLNGLYFIAFHYCNGLVETKKYLFIN